MNGDQSGLKRGIGFFGAAFIILNSLIGAGIFALPGKVAANAGLLSPWMFLVIGVLLMAIVLVFAELASYFRSTGGPVLYAQQAFGPFPGFLTGWTLYLSRVTAFAANANVMTIYLAQSYEPFGNEWARVAIITLITTGLTWANYHGIKDAVRTMAVFSLLKLLPLSFLILLGLTHVTGETLLPGMTMDEINQLGPTSLLLIYAYLGFETIGATAGETANPRRNLPLALVSMVAAISILYFLIMLVFVSVIPAENYANATLIDVGQILAGTAGALIITVAAVFSIGGNLSATMISAPRVVFSMAEQKTIPALFGRVHPEHATPHVSILFTGSLALILALSGSFVLLAVASSVIRLLGYLICIAAVPVLRRKVEDKSRAFVTPGGYTIPVIAFLLCLWLLTFSTAKAWLVVSILIIIGTGLYGLEKYLARQKAD